MTTGSRNGTGRFPAPREKWILDQLSKGLLSLYGNRNEYTPDRFHDLVDYVYRIETPEGGPYDQSLVLDFLADGIPAAFIIGDVIELDGMKFRVLDYTSQRSATSTNGRESFSYTYWHVQVVPISRSSCG